MKYKAFISYRHSENGRRHALALELALKRYAKPSLAFPMKIFRDEKHMKPGSLSEQVREGLENSEYLIFLAEKASADSEWCGEELEYWCNAKNLNRKQNLIIILIGDEIFFNKTQSINFDLSTALPSLLQPYLTSIPLYLDLRWAKSETDTDLQNLKYRHVINSLSAKLKGVTPEDLNDDEIRIVRRNIQLRNGAWIILSLMLLTSISTTIWAVDAQKKSEKSAAEAKKQQQIAEQNLADRIEQERQKERLNFDKYVSNGDVYTESYDYKFALREYRKADSILMKFPDDQKLLGKKEALMNKIKNATTNMNLSQ